MEYIITQTQIEIEPGQCISKYVLDALGIYPTDIDCFEYNPYLLFKKENKRYVVQPKPFDQFKIIKIYDFIPARYA